MTDDTITIPEEIAAGLERELLDWLNRDPSEYPPFPADKPIGDEWKGWVIGVDPETGRWAPLQKVEGGCYVFDVSVYDKKGGHDED